MRVLVPSAILAVALSSAFGASAQTWGQPQAQPTQPGQYPQQQPTQPGQYPQQQPPQPGQYPQQQPPGQYPGAYAEPNGTQSAQEAELNQAEHNDSGRGLEIAWLNGEIGFSGMSLQALNGDKLVDEQELKDNSSGLMYGAGLGARLIFMTAGVRFRLANFSDWDLWSLNAEVGMHLPLGNWDPYFSLGGGYVSVGGFDKEVVGSLDTQDVDISGFNVRTVAGLDYYLTPKLSLGAALSAEMLVLSRSAIAGLPSVGANAAVNSVYSAEGSGLGFGYAGTVVVGLHFEAP